MDPSLLVAQNETFFFEQSSFRQSPKRCKKRPEELPHDLRFAHLNPRVAAYLANKEKDQKGFDDGLGDKSLLPQINRTVTDIRHRLDSILSSESDAQRVLFEEIRNNAVGVLEHLAKVLYMYEGLKPHLPKSLENLLLYNWKELVFEAKYSNRDWQIAGNKEAFEKSKHSETSNKGEGKEEEEELKEDHKNIDGRKTNFKMTRNSISENRADANVRVVDTELPNLMASKSLLQSRRTSAITPKSRSSIIKDCLLDSKEISNLPESAAGSRSSVVYARVKAGKPDDMSAVAESEPENVKPGHGQPSFVQTIQFQLSSKACDDRGWIIHHGSKDDTELKNVLEWCTIHLQASMRQSANEKLTEKEQGLDQPVSVKFYGDGLKEQLYKYKGRSRERINTALLKGQTPKIPTLPDGDGQPLYMTTTSDGSTTVFYPTGDPAIVTSRNVPGEPGVYTFAYDNTPEKRLMATFTPSGRSVCYHENGVVNFLCNDKGGTMAEHNGAINKRWTWPSQGMKLPAPINIVLNSCVTFHCGSKTQMSLHFTCNKEQARFNVGVTSGVKEPPTRENLGHLQTGFPFTSRTSREFSRPFKPKLSNSKMKVRGKGRSRSPVINSEIQKLLADMPMEHIENDVIADKELIRMQRKVKMVTEDWMEHYRVAVGMIAPMLKTMKDSPMQQKSRNSSSAKSSLTGQHNNIEISSVNIPTATISYRAPSAPVARSNRPQSAGSETPSDQPQCVKFVENPPEETDDLDQFSNERLTSLPSTIASIGGSSAILQNKRTKSAPQRLSTVNTETLGPNAGLCTVALRISMMGMEKPTCHCTRHYVPFITDLEYDKFIDKQLPKEQLLIVSIISSIYPFSDHGQEMLLDLHAEQNKNRSRPCMQSRSDSFRILLYDIATAAKSSSHKDPLLLQRHNVIPGMFLMYLGRNLVFCDHIFNGYGNELKDFQKQMMITRRSANLGRWLPKDFKFSPQRGRNGLRSAWGGQIGGAGVDHHGNPGLPGNTFQPVSSSSSLDSGDYTRHPYSLNISGLDTSKKVVHKSLNASAFNTLPSSPRTMPRRSLGPASHLTLPHVNGSNLSRRHSIKTR